MFCAPARPLVFVPLVALALAACSGRTADLRSPSFACATGEACADGFVCRAQVCVAIGSMEDVGDELSAAPMTGPVGTLVTLTGANMRGFSKVTVNDTEGLVISRTERALVFMVMPGSTTARITAHATSGSVLSKNVFSVTPTVAPTMQRGAALSALDGPGAVTALAVSADGTTALVGGSPVWVWNRRGEQWEVSPMKLVGSGALEPSSQGSSVALSADGNTALVGGVGDDARTGAVWAWSRVDGQWIQQGNKLLASNASASAAQGCSVALSADGNTALIGGYGDNGEYGAAWVWTRDDSQWTQREKLVASSNSYALQGASVALSADGRTALVSGQRDDQGRGGAWAWVRDAAGWVPHGAKLVVTDAEAAGFNQGYAVALSADGTVAVLGAYRSASNIAAAWVFARTPGGWAQQGGRLNDANARELGIAGRTSVAVSADGTLLMLGARDDEGQVGATWFFARSASGQWAQQGEKVVGTGASALNQGQSVALTPNGQTALVGSYGVGNPPASAPVWVLVTP